MQPAHHMGLFFYSDRFPVETPYPLLSHIIMHLCRCGALQHRYIFKSFVKAHMTTQFFVDGSDSGNAAGSTLAA